MRIIFALKLFVLFLLAGLPLLFSGCAPGYLMIREAGLRQFELRIQAQEERLELLSTEQTGTQGALLESHSELANQLQMIAQTQAELVQRQKEWENYIRSTRRQSSAEEDKEIEIQDSSTAMVTEDKQVVGSVEKVFLSPPGTILSARVDTGATSSSLDARNIVRFERNGERWVRFTISNPEGDNEIILERKVVRNVRILQASAEESERRPVVELGVTVGKTTQTAQFTLSDRRHLEYPVLIGRNILMDILVVDVSRSHIAPPQLPVSLSEQPVTP